jgi:hypothetical protein
MSAWLPSARTTRAEEPELWAAPTDDDDDDLDIQVRLGV